MSRAQGFVKVSLDRSGMDKRQYRRARRRLARTCQPDPIGSIFVRVVASTKKFNAAMKQMTKAMAAFEARLPTPPTSHDTFEDFGFDR